MAERLAIFSEWAAAHSLFLCLCFGTAVSAIWLVMFCKRLSLPRSVILPLAIVHTLAGLVCVKLFAAAESFGNALTSGNSLFGAVFFLPAVYFAGAKLSRRRFRDVFDVFVLCIISVLIFARISCIVSGCCEGEVIPGHAPLRWPVREMEILFHTLLLIFFLRKMRRIYLQGELFPLYMISYGIFRFFDEWLRSGQAVLGPLHRGHIWSVFSILIGCAVYFELHGRENDRTKRVGNRKKRR